MKSLMRKIIFLACGLLMFATMQAAMAAKRLGPPIEELQSTPDRIRIVVAEARNKPEPGKIGFFVSERLTGEAPAEVVLRTDAATYADVALGESYIVAWTDLRRNRRVIGGWEEDPEGPSIVATTGLGSIALFEDTQEMRYLFTPDAIADPEGPSKQVEALLHQMLRSDYRSRGLVIMELYLRPDLTERMTPEQAEVLMGILQKLALDPQHRDFLFRSALRLPGELTFPWLAEELRKVIIHHGAQYDLRSFVPGLIRTAARGLQQVGEPADIELLDILLYSNNPGVARAALAAMDQLDSEAAATRSDRAIGRDWIHSDTRLALNRYLNRGNP